MHMSFSVELKITIGKSTIKTQCMFYGNLERTYATHPNEFKKPTMSRRIKFILNMFYNDAHSEVVFK